MKKVLEETIIETKMNTLRAINELVTEYGPSLGAEKLLRISQAIAIIEGEFLSDVDIEGM